MTTHAPAFFIQASATEEEVRIVGSEADIPINLCPDAVMELAALFPKRPPGRLYPADIGEQHLDVFCNMSPLDSESVELAYHMAAQRDNMPQGLKEYLRICANNGLAINKYLRVPVRS